LCSVQTMVNGEGVSLFDQNSPIFSKSSQNSSPGQSCSDVESCPDDNVTKSCPTQDFQKSFCKDPIINQTLANLHDRLKHGDKSVQCEIDTYLIACACEDSLSWDTLQMLRPEPHDVAQYNTLPDITRFIPFSFTSDPGPGIIAYYMQLLSPLKRKSRIRRGFPTSPTCNVEASVCLNLIQATLLGLYPRSTKKPIWRTRVAIAGSIYKLHTAPFETQCKFLSLSHDLLRVCFTEYIANVRVDFCQVENRYLSRHASFLPSYDVACFNLFDHIRQTCVQLTNWNWGNLNSSCLSALDRVSRMCRTQLIQPQIVPNFGSVKVQHIKNAMTRHVVYSDQHYTALQTSASITAMIHDTIQVHMLPWNMVTMQATRIVQNFSDSLFPVLTACEKHICVRCTHGTNARLVQRVSKLRMDTTTMQITCATCKTEDTVVRINVFGKLLSIRNIKYFACQECTALHIYDPVNPLKCTRYNLQAPIPRLQQGDRSSFPMIPTEPEGIKNLEKRTDKKNRCKWCGRVCSARTLQLLHVPSASVVHITLCFKHFPPAFMLKMIIDVDTFVRYVVDMTNTMSQSAGRMKVKRLKK
jgi:hypothetical protein